MAQVEISLVAGDRLDVETDWLSEWLRTDSRLRGQVSTPAAEPVPGKLGGLSEVLVVALGGGGAATVFVKLMSDWVVARRPKVRVKLTQQDGSSVEFDTENLTGDQVAELVKGVVEAEDRD